MRKRVNTLFAKRAEARRQNVYGKGMFTLMLNQPKDLRIFSRYQQFSKPKSDRQVEIKIEFRKVEGNLEITKYHASVRPK